MFIVTRKVIFLIFKTPLVTFGNYRLFLSAFSRFLLWEVKFVGKRLRHLASCETFLPFPFAVPCYLSQGPSVKRCGRQCWACRHDPVCICSTSSLPWRLHSPPSSLTASPKPVDSAGVPKGQLPGHYPGVIHALCCLETPVNEESLMSGQGQGVPLSCLKGAIQLSTGQEGQDVLRAPRSAFTFHCFCDGSGVM